ncbi:hypothetical protein [Azospirillum sp. sgz301742]
MEKMRVSFRLEAFYIEMLDRLVKGNGVSNNRSDELRMAIIAEYERVFGQGSSVELMQKFK